MARIRLARWLYALALLAMPLSYATRDLFGVVGITWIDPTLILGLAVFLLLGAPVEEKTSLWLVGYAFLSALIGAFLMSASADREKSALYIYYVEPIRLTLNIIWFWNSIFFLKLDRRFVLRWLAVCVAWEFSIACFLYLAFFDLVPVPEAVKLYLEIYKTRQLVYWGDLPIYRMAGTFVESPPFGLFMFSCFFILVLTLSNLTEQVSRRFKMLLTAGAFCSFLGTVASLSDQTLVALLILGVVFVLVGKGSKPAIQRLIWSSLAIGLILYVFSAEGTRLKNDLHYTGDPMGTSIAERAFHTKYGLGLFIEHPVSVITGIGPGRYGDYAVRTQYFPSTVTMQVTVIDWAVEYGFLGLALICLWLSRIGSRAALRYGVFGLGALAALVMANMFQANWVWESWFLALAFLYAGPPTKVSGHHEEESTNRLVARSLG